MAEVQKSTRLGDLLVERRVITRQQLARAIELQQERRLQDMHAGDEAPHRHELGELLIELGFITRKQLKRGLGWQYKLRKASFAMALFAPLLTAACGGGGGGGGPGASANPAPRSSTASSLTVTPTNPGQVASSSSSPSFTSSAQSSIHSPVQPSMPEGSSSSTVDKGGVSSSSASSLPSSAPSSSAPADEEAVEVDGEVAVYWSPPTERENGDYLELDEIGGYELRYKKISEDNFTSIFIEGSDTDAYYFDNLEGEYEFELATYDTAGLYSRFVKVTPQ